MILIFNLFCSQLHKPSVSPKFLWTPTLVHYTSYSMKDLIVTVHELANILANAGEVKLQAVRRKYRGSRLMKIALLPNLINAANNIMTELRSKNNIAYL